MGAYFARRLLLVIPTLIGVTTLGFAITRLVPGGPVEKAIREAQMGGAMGGEAGMSGGVTTEASGITDEHKKALEEQYGFDKPWYEAYWKWLKDVAVLDFGESYHAHEPVMNVIKERLPISITFGLTGFLLAYLISVPLGIFKAIRHGGFFDFTSSAAVFIGYSIPGWALGMLLLLFLASGRFYDAMPLTGIKSTTYDSLPDMVKEVEDPKKVNKDGLFVWEKMSVKSKLIDSVWHMLLPIFCYMMGSFATLTLLTKNSLMDNLGQDYVRTAFAKGLSPTRVIFLHAMRNSLIPLATGLGRALTIVMAGSYLIEYTFSINGIGYLGYDSIIKRDYTVVMGILTINAALVMLGNILSDVMYAIIDPRIRFE